MAVRLTGYLVIYKILHKCVSHIKWVEDLSYLDNKDTEYLIDRQKIESKKNIVCMIDKYTYLGNLIRINNT